jgi:hypothetical protein
MWTGILHVVRESVLPLPVLCCSRLFARLFGPRQSLLGNHFGPVDYCHKIRRLWRGPNRSPALYQSLYILERTPVDSEAEMGSKYT